MQPATSRKLPTEEQTKSALWQPGHAPALPGRFLVPVYHLVSTVMDDRWAGAVGASLKQHRAEMQWCDDASGRYWQLDNLMNLEPQGMAMLRQKLLSHVADACKAVHVDEFDLTNITMTAQLHHHGCSSAWSTEALDNEGNLDTTRRVAFDYFLHSTPLMFQHGGTEFHDGTCLKPEHNQLMFTHPLQKRCVQSVDCYSNDMLHGRWSIRGHLHGPAPDGYEELAQRLLG